MIVPELKPWRLKGKGIRWYRRQDLDAHPGGRRGLAIMATDGVRLEIIQAENECRMCPYLGQA